MPTVSVVYEPEQPAAERLGDLIGPGTDMVLIWREWGDDFEGGSRTHVVGDGAWSNVTLEQVRDALDRLGDL